MGESSSTLKTFVSQWFAGVEKRRGGVLGGNTEKESKKKKGGGDGPGGKTQDRG